jgi:F420-dependent oxidoreductase-like protein
VRFSFWPTAGQPWSEILDVARHAEATGWDGVWFADHFMPFAGDVGGPMQECWTVLAALAAAVPRVRLGSMVTGNTYRHPAVLAKQVATVDQISGGRVVLGLGAGWQENEHVAYGIEYDTVKGRLDRFDEACAVITSLLREERTTFDGEHYALRDAPLSPKPVRGHLPLLVGGGGERRTLRIAARWADEWNVWGTPELLRHKSDVLARHCEALGRDPATISHSANALLFLSTDEDWLEGHRGRDHGRAAIVGTPAEVVEICAAYAAVGVDELVVPDFTLGDPARKRATMDLFLGEVAPHLRQG